jgi:Arc/MetJ-type ribon-helix-helix transcriptional regulator
VDDQINIRIPSDLKKRFHAALVIGRRSSASDVMRELITAYVERVEKEKRQPEFPLRIEPRE